MIYDRVQETTSTTGTGAITTSGSAASGMRTLAAAVGGAYPKAVAYVIFDELRGDWETGIGTLTAATTLQRGVRRSSNNNALVSFGTGTKQVFSAPTEAVFSAIPSLLAMPVQTSVADINAALLPLGVANAWIALTVADLINAVGVAADGLPEATSLLDNDILTVSRGGSDMKVRAAVLKAYVGGTSAPSDTTAPTLTSATASATSATGASGAVTTNEGNGTLYWLFSTSSTATAAAVKAGSSKAVSASGAQNVAGSGLTASTTYYLHFLHRDAAGNDSSVLTSASFTTQSAGTPATAPGAPTIGTAVAGDGYVDVYFTNGADGGSPILDSTATLSTGQTATGTSSPIRITAANGVAVTATVKHRNAVGTGPASSASNSVTPQAAPQTAYTITGYSGNAVKETYDASTNTGTIYGGQRSTTTGPFTNGNGYFSITPAPASAMSGWGDSPTVPPPEVTAAANADGSIRAMGLVAMTKPAAWANQSRLWFTVGAVNPKMYFWIKPVDGAPYCMNPNGMTITGA